jgi:hypothetical protein
MAPIENYPFEKNFFTFSGQIGTFELCITQILLEHGENFFPVHFVKNFAGQIFKISKIFDLECFFSIFFNFNRCAYTDNHIPIFNGEHFLKRLFCSKIHFGRGKRDVYIKEFFK